MKLALFGYGGHAREVAAQINEEITFFVDDEYVNEFSKPISTFDPEVYQMMVAVADSKEREKIVKKLPQNTSYFTFVHPTVLLMSEDIQIGIGSFIGAYSILTTNITLGNHAILNRGNQIGHDSKIGDFFSAMPGVIISGNVVIGTNVYMGNNSSIREKINISSNVIIGANATVVKNIITSGTYVGVPAKLKSYKLQEGDPDDIKKLHNVNPKIGIVIPTYQRPDGLSPLYLSNALNSIKNQTFKNYKVFLIGDRYEDNDEFIKIATSIIDSDKIYYENLPFAEERDNYGDNNLAIWNYGGVNATNYGIEISLNQGYDYICHLDHDDTWDSNHLLLISSTIAKTDASFVFTKSKHKNSIFPNINSDDEIIEILPENERLIRSSVCMNFKEIPLRYRDIFKETGMVGLPGDGDLWNRVKEWIIKNGLKSYLINEKTCIHEQEGYSLNLNLKMKKVALISTFCDTSEKIDVLEKNIKIIKNHNLDVIVISPFNLPEYLTKQCDYFLITKDNPILDWPTKAMYVWRVLNVNEVKYTMTKTLADYGFAGLTQIKQLSQIALGLDYNQFYHMIYDIKIDENVIEGFYSNRTNNVYPSKRTDKIWEVGLHFLIFNKENLKNFISYINLETYLDVKNGDAFKLLHTLQNKLNYVIEKTPVEDEIYYYENIDFLDCSPIEGIKFFIENDDENPSSIKILFYDVVGEKEIKVKIGETESAHTISSLYLIDLGFNKFNLQPVTIEVDDTNYDITDIIKKIKHSTLSIS